MKCFESINKQLRLSGNNMKYSSLGKPAVGMAVSRSIYGPYSHLKGHSYAIWDKKFMFNIMVDY